MSRGTQVAGTRDSGFIDRYGKSTGAIFVALIVLHLPIISLINFIPTFKEAVLGAVVVAGLTTISDTKTGIKYALVAGMLAAVLFNLVWIPAQFLLGGVFGAAGSGGESAAASGVVGGLVSGLGALTNLIGLVIFSPVGYAVGGALGTVVND
jgi:MFS family permease